MQIELKGTNKREHVSQTVAQVLIAAGLASEVKPDPLSQWMKPTHWQAFSPMNPDYPPSLKWSCPSCSHAGESSKAIYNLVEPVRHGGGCKGMEEYPPADIVERFKDLYKAWENRSKPQPKMIENPRRFIFQKVG
jgi:hypothetical protein